MDKIISARVGAQRWYERYPRSVPLGAFVLTMALTLVSVVAMERSNEERERTEMHALANVVASALERRAAGHVAYLRAGAALMANDRTINQAGFMRFAAELRNDAEYRGGQGLTWAPVVPRDKVPAFEAARRAEGMAGYAVHPAPGPAEPLSVPVAYMGEINPRTRIALGYDMYSDPLRRAAMDEAVRTDRAIATNRVTLMIWQGPNQQAGFVVYLPVYARGGSRRLLGFIATPFNATAFLDSSVNLRELRGFGVRLYDGEIRPDRLMAEINTRQDSYASTTAPVHLAQRKLMLEVTAEQPDALTPLSWITLAMGTMLALLLMAFARLVTRQAAEDRAALGWLREQASIRASLTRELNHRVKNTLANVLSIIALTRYRATSLADFAESLDGRIRALSATHDLLTASEWAPTPLGAVAAAELAPYATGAPCQVALHGPDVRLAPNDALLFGLAIHELATNACKYGALSQPGGRVTVSWALASAERVSVEWLEEGGPPVSGAHGRGFGMDLLERIVAHELGHSVEMDFRPTGLSCRLAVPVRRPAAFLIRGGARKNTEAESD
ncbi:MAG TPA: CHASE domain-containing protein [Novosphingobium sp.]|nr:CHASE domain-containing protein [Novosphingobium sp.]